MIEAETGRRFGSVAALLFLSAAQRRVLLALADVNPVGADGGLCPELSSGSHQAHVGKGLTLKSPWQHKGQMSTFLRKKAGKTLGGTEEY